MCTWVALSCSLRMGGASQQPSAASNICCLDGLAACYAAANLSSEVKHAAAIVMLQIIINLVVCGHGQAAGAASEAAALKQAEELRDAGLLRGFGRARQVLCAPVHMPATRMIRLGKPPSRPVDQPRGILSPTSCAIFQHVSVFASSNTVWSDNLFLGCMLTRNVTCFSRRRFGWARQHFRRICSMFGVHDNHDNYEVSSSALQHDLLPGEHN